MIRLIELDVAKEMNSEIEAIEKAGWLRPQSPDQSSEPEFQKVFEARYRQFTYDLTPPTRIGESSLHIQRDLPNTLNMLSS